MESIEALEAVNIVVLFSMDTPDTGVQLTQYGHVSVCCHPIMLVSNIMPISTATLDLITPYIVIK